MKFHFLQEVSDMYRWWLKLLTFIPFHSIELRVDQNIFSIWVTTFREIQKLYPYKQQQLSPKVKISLIKYKIIIFIDTT